MEPVTGAAAQEHRAPTEIAPEAPARQPVGPWRCAADPSVETYLRCGRCEKPICPRCLIQTPVGSRCRDCAQLRKLPMFQVGAIDYLRAVGGGLAAGLAGGLIVIFLQGQFRVFGMLSVMLLAALGYGIGTAVAKSTRRKQGTGLGVIAALAVPIGLALGRAALLVTVTGADAVPALLVGFAALLGGSLWNLLGLLLAMGIAFSRAR
jgi:hypothetical protein